MVPLSAREKTQQRLIDNSWHFHHLQQGYECVHARCEGACVYACGTCVYGGRFQTACLYWKAQEGDLSDKMVCIVCSINMPTFLNLPSCKRRWRLKQATHYSCMRAFRALLDSIVKCGFLWLWLFVLVCVLPTIHSLYNRWCFLSQLLLQEGKDDINTTTEHD